MRPLPPREDRRGGRARPPRHARPAASGRGRARRPRRTGALALVAVLVLAVGAPVALARVTRGAAQYGVTVAGRDVSGMTRGQIAADVEARARDVSVSVTVGGRTTRAGLAEAGARVDAGATADAALAGSGSVRAGASALVRGRDVPVSVSVDAAALAAFAARVDDGPGTAPVDAAVRLGREGAVFEAVDGVSGRGADRAVLASLVTRAAQTLTDQGASLPLAEVRPDVTDEEAARAAAEANGLLDAEISLDADGAVTTADAPTRASWIDTAAVDGTISPAPSREKVAQWVDAAAAPIERAPISGVDNVDADGNVLEPARPPKPGRAVTNRDAETDAIVTAMQSREAHAGRLVAQEVPAPTERRVVPAGPERFAYRAAEGEKWVDVNLTDSTLTAYEGYTQVHGPILINHGGVGHETVTGTYHVYLKHAKQDMGCTPEWPYCERDVPWIAYWYKDYALHGAPWVKEFGIGTDESSHGCINIPVEDAHWIHDWVQIGTTVVTHR